jgi:hypothetical protein
MIVIVFTKIVTGTYHVSEEPTVQFFVVYLRIARFEDSAATKLNKNLKDQQQT